MASILVRHKVEIPVFHIVGTPNLTFHKWLPVDDPIISEDDNLVVKIWLDASNTYHGADSDPLKWNNVLVESVFVDVTIKEIDSHLIDLILDKKTANEAEKNKVVELSTIVYSSVTSRINRLIDWANSMKQQYWLSNIPVDLGRILRFNIDTEAKAIMLPESDNKWFNWRPNTPQHMEVVITSEETYINRKDWQALKDYVNSEQRIKFKLELISRAYTLNSISLRTNALIDAVTALEIAISDFVKSPSIDSDNYQKVLSSIGTSNLSVAFDHLKFSTFIQYLLPLILDEPIIKEIDFVCISEALQARNNIVHNGQRDLEKKKSIKYLASIRKLIMYLNEHSS